jgi:hypothetical protein
VAGTAVVAGSADGLLALGVTGPLDDPRSFTASAGGAAVPSAVLAGGLVILLAARRRLLTPRAMPGSPVYATDSSPD